MDRSGIWVIAVVVAAVALFGLRFISGRSDDVGSEVALRDEGGRLDGARIGEGEPDGPGSAGDRRIDGPRGRLGALAGGRRDANGGSDRPGPGGRSGSAALAAAGGRSGSSPLGVSGSSARGSAGSGATIGGDADGGRLGPRAQRKGDIVESLSSLPPSDSDLAKPLEPEDGDDIALKVDKPEDIREQQGAEQDVKKPDDSDEGLVITERGRVEFPNAGNANGDAGTISFRIKPEWAGADATDNALVQIRQEHQWNNRLELVKNGEFLRFIITDDTGREADISTRITNWQNLEEHDIKATWGDGHTTLYIDGQVVGQNQYSGQLRFAEGTPMFLGADHRGSAYAGANATFNQFTLSTTASHP